MTDLISSLRESFGAPPDTSTIKGIKSYTEFWISGEQGATSEHLADACKQMINILAQAIVDTEAELATTGRTHDSLADPVERSLQAYERLQEILADLQEAVVSRQRDEARELLVEMQEAADFLRESQLDLQEWVSKDVLRCPRCGGTEADPCPACGLLLMYLDPEGGANVANDASVSLPQEFGALYSAFLEIRDGKTSLAKLKAVLPKAERSVNSFLASVQAARTQNQDSSNLVDGETHLLEMKDGLSILRATLTSRRITELQDGWLKLFRGAAGLQSTRLALLEEFGGEEGREMAKKVKESRTNLDSVSWSNDD